MAGAQGRGELAEQLYAEAMKEAPAQSSSGRSVRWNYGWDLLRQGKPEAALEQWLASAANARTKPSWVPPTYALALWRMGQKQEAVQWYAAAVRTEPTQWNTTANYAQLLPQWREDERASLAEVQQAWRRTACLALREVRPGCTRHPQRQQPKPKQQQQRSSGGMAGHCGFAGTP